MRGDQGDELKGDEAKMGEQGCSPESGKDRSSGKTVILDTNALLIPGEFRVDIFEELARLGYLDIIVPRVVLEELDKLRKSPGLKGRDRIAANVGYLLVQMHTDNPAKHVPFRVSVEEGVEEGGEGARNTDKLLLSFAVRRNAAVLTNDERLRRKLRRAGVPTVYLREGRRLEESE